MSQRKALDESRHHLTATAKSVRAKQESKAFELGCPAPPDYLWNQRELWGVWKRTSALLLEHRKLAYCDGVDLLALCQATLTNNVERKKTLLSIWNNRPAFPKPIQDENKLDDFLADVADERETFSQRVVPTQTVLLDNGIPYDFPEDDAATVARQYAVTSLGSDDVGALMKYASSRFLNDLETGHERGLFFDPLAVRNVVRFMKVFGGLENILPWEVWIVAGIFGFKHASGIRVVTEAHLSMGRKNGKTRLAASLGLFLLIADQEKYAEVYCCSTAKEQSRICWRDARRVVGDNLELVEHVTRWAGELNVKTTDSKMQALASEERSFLGVRASGIICDELGVWADRNAYDAIVQSTVSRSQPLTISITTAPQNRSMFCFEKFSWCEKVLRGIVRADHIFAAIWRIDDGDDPKDIIKLRKANPSLGTILPEEHIKKQIAELDDMPSGLNNFLQFHANITPENSISRQGSIAAKKWDACACCELIGEKDPEKAITKFLLLNTDTPAYLGVDIGMSGDTTAVALLFPRARFSENAEAIKRPTVIVQVFQPEIGILEKERIWGVPLSTWARQGFLQLLPGDITDLREIKKQIVDLHQKFRIRECGFDPWSFPTQAAQLNEMGITCVAVPQVPSQLTAPIQELSSAIHSGELVHFGSPMLAWMSGNVVFAESERHAGLKLEKLSPNEKIDGISAIINAWHRYLANPPSGMPMMFFMNDDGQGVRADGNGGLVPLSPLQKRETK